MRFKAWIAALALAVGVLAGPGASAQTAAEPMPIYSNQLASGWDNWSWASVVLGVRSDGDERPIQVNAQGWQALYFRHAPFSTSGYATLSFWINGGPEGGQTISVVAMNAAGEAIADRVFLFTPVTNDWAHVEVPLADLRAADTMVSGFWIQNGTPGQTPTFFVNEVSLVP